MFGSISIEHGWIALTFLMNLVRVSQRLYFKPVFAIAKGIIASFGKMEMISILVFSPLVRAISNGAQGSEDEIAFLAAVERRRTAKVRFPDPEITFHLLNLELKMNTIPLLPLDERFRQTPTFRLIEKKIAIAPQSELHKLKKDFAVPRNSSCFGKYQFDKAGANRRIDSFLAEVKCAMEPQLNLQSDLFAFRSVDHEYFKPVMFTLRTVPDDAFFPQFHF
jgi:hypothetical protein